MHFNRDKIKQSKLKISPRQGKKKKIKSSNRFSEYNPIRPIVKSKKKNSKLKIISSLANTHKLGNKFNYKPLSEWSGLLDNHTAFILGNAPSISDQDLNLLKPYFTIGINRIYYIHTPVVLIWQDIELWTSEKKNIIKQKSIKVCNHTSDPTKSFLNFKVKIGKLKFGSNPSVLHGTGNTTALAVQLAVNLGCSNIVLLGTDCKYGKKNKTNFYGNNKDHKSYTLQMCNESMEWIRDNCPIPIYNCSKNKLWPKENLSDVIKEIQPKKMNMKKYIRIFKK